MPKLIPVGYADCALHFTRTADLEEMLITFGVEITDPGPPGIIAEACANAYTTAWPTNSYPSALKFVRATARIAVEGGEEVVEEELVNVSGTLSTTMSPSNCAVLVQKKTNRGGRRGRGRFYVPWVDGAKVDANGILGATEQTSYQAKWTSFLDTLEAGSTTVPLNMVLLHNDDGITAAGQPTRVTHLQLQPQIATQRRRLRP